MDWEFSQETNSHFYILRNIFSLLFNPLLLLNLSLSLLQPDGHTASNKLILNYFSIKFLWWRKSEIGTFHQVDTTCLAQAGSQGQESASRPHAHPAASLHRLQHQIPMNPRMTISVVFFIWSACHCTHENFHLKYSTENSLNNVEVELLS